MSQHAGDLRTLVARRAGLKRRVALLVADAALKDVLEKNGCTVLVDPSLEELSSFDPQVIAAFDGFASEKGEAFRQLARAAPAAELVFSFANAASASLLLGSLLGATPSPSLSEVDVRAWLASAGYVVTTRDVVVMPRVPLKLAAETEAALRQTLEQLNPAAAGDRLLLTAKRGTEASAAEVVKGLTSVVISSGTDTGALEGTVRSVAGQLRRPLELLVVSQTPELELDRALKAARGRADLQLIVLPGGGDALARTNAGLRAARGQYVCLLEAGELLERPHLSTLVKQLEDGTAAWALSSAKTRGGLRGWLEAGAVHRGRFVLDRERLGAFPLQLAEGVPLAEAMFFARLWALFTPALASGAPTFDTQRVVESSPAGLREVLRGRPLRTLAEVDLREPPPVDVAEELESQLRQRSAPAAKWFHRARELAARVQDAAEAARTKK